MTAPTPLHDGDAIECPVCQGNTDEESLPIRLHLDDGTVVCLFCMGRGYWPLKRVHPIGEETPDEMECK